MKTFFHYPIKKHLLLILLAIMPVSAIAQEEGSCAEKLQTAQNLFDRGQVEQVAGLLQECLKSGFTREESLTAYKLIIQTYLFEDRLMEADSAMLDFLKRNPEYQLSPTDHSSFVMLFNTFQVKAMVQLSFHLGTNVPFLTGVTSNHVTEPVSSTYSAEYPNIYLSLEAKFGINKKMEVNIESAYSQLRFTNTLVIEEPDNGVTTYTETQKRIEIPLSLTYNFKNFGKFTPYGRLGAGTAFLLMSTAAAEFDPADQNGTPRTGPELSRDASRISLDVFAQAGAGVKYKTRGGYFFTELRSNFGFLNQVVLADNIPEVGELGGFYYYADDGFRLNAVNFSLGYTQIFYKPSKR